MKKIDNKLYYQVAAWMINDLNLKGQELICYAIIYSLSQLGQGRYFSGLDYLASFMQCSQPTASKALKGLQDRGLIAREEVTTDTGRRVLYYCTNPDERGDAKDSFRGVNKNFMDGVNKKFMDNNINNKEYNNKNNKRLSNDNPKVEYSEDFISFWKLYHNGGKQQAYKEWNKLTQKEKQKAIDNVNDYLKYCKYKGRTIKDTSSYLHQKGFDEDWLATPECYVVQDTDDDKVAKFKTFMVWHHKELIYHRNPLTYEQAHEYAEKYIPEQVQWALNKLKQRDIHQYFSIAKGIEAVIADDPIFDEMEKEEEQ